MFDSIKNKSYVDLMNKTYIGRCKFCKKPNKRLKKYDNTCFYGCNKSKKSFFN